MDIIWTSITRRLSSSSTDDDLNTNAQTDSLINTLYVNLIIFCILITLFEINRHFKSIYFPRLQSRFKKSKRVPVEPAWYPFAWLYEISKISEDDLLKMIGLDAYMLMRYLNLCFRSSMFLSFFGVVVLVPVYATAGGTSVAWNRYTMANIRNSASATELWVPAVFAYVFAAYYCYLLHAEYKNFMEKRLRYLMEGDPNTPKQTYYTVMAEHLPSDLRSAEQLYEFFNNIFPGGVHSVELALDLGELDGLVARRKTIRDQLEKAIAVWEASQRRTRPVVWVPNAFYENISDPLKPVAQSTIASCMGHKVYDSIDHHEKLLGLLNARVKERQRAYSERARSKVESGDLRGRLEVETRNMVGFVKEKLVDNVVNKFAGSSGRDDSTSVDKLALTPGNARDVAVSSESKGDSDLTSPNLLSSAINEKETMATPSTSELQPRKVLAKVVGTAAAAAESGVGTLANEAKIATSSALKGVLEATRTLELLTVGAYYKTSTTAFITLKSRVASSSACQMLLSHEYFTMIVKPAPNPKDIIWDNVSIPYRQVTSRSSIADTVLIIGALFWSAVVGFITAWSNLESISEKLTWLKAYQGTEVYRFLNTYLALGLLLILLAILPFIFDLIARSYEGMKLESEIQNVIMTRYFYYQLANVFVSVGLGSIAASLNQIINQPYSILTILGTSLPTFSTYFTQLVIIKTFTAVPIELLRIWPLISILSVKMCMNKKTCTRRELRTGIFADPPMWYGWIYPNIMMVLMIMLTYSTISPLLTPVAMVYFGSAYIMYKYQLLYVYINEEQSGGFMWYAVFNRSMVALLGGTCTLLAYMLIRETFFSGPFYLLLPLPVLILYFWHHCESKFKIPTLNISLMGAIQIDQAAAREFQRGKAMPYKSFSSSLFKQPSLAEGRLRPAPYRKHFVEPQPNKKSYAPSNSASGLEAGLVINAIHTDSDQPDEETCGCGSLGEADPRRRHHHHGSDAAGARSRLSSDEFDEDSDEELTDDFDPDEVRESEVNEILADERSSSVSDNSSRRISFAMPHWVSQGLHMASPTHADGQSLGSPINKSHTSEGLTVEQLGASSYGSIDSSKRVGDIENGSAEGDRSSTVSRYSDIVSEWD